MVDFIPRVIAPMQPLGAEVGSPAQPESPWRRLYRVIVPVSRAIDLETVSGEVVPVPGTIYQYDYFLMHPSDGAIQRVWFAASTPAEQSEFSVQLVNRDGEELSEGRSFTELPTAATSLFEQVGAIGSEAVFFRVNAEAQVAILYVTVELLLNEAR